MCVCRARRRRVGRGAERLECISAHLGWRGAERLECIGRCDEQEPRARPWVRTRVYSNWERYIGSIGGGAASPTAGKEQVDQMVGEDAWARARPHGDRTTGRERCRGVAP